MEKDIITLICNYLSINFIGEVTIGKITSPSFAIKITRCIFLSLTSCSKNFLAIITAVFIWGCPLELLFSFLVKKIFLLTCSRSLISFLNFSYFGYYFKTIRLNN